MHTLKTIKTNTLATIFLDLLEAEKTVKKTKAIIKEGYAAGRYRAFVTKTIWQVRRVWNKEYEQELSKIPEIHTDKLITPAAAMKINKDFARKHIILKTSYVYKRKEAE